MRTSLAIALTAATAFAAGGGAWYLRGQSPNPEPAQSEHKPGHDSATQAGTAKPVDDTCLAVRFTGYASPNPNTLDLASAGGLDVAARNSPLQCEGFQRSLGRLTARFCHGIARFENQYARTVAPPSAKTRAAMEAPAQADRLLATLSAVPFDVGNYPMQLFILRADAVCADAEWDQLETTLGSDTGAMDQCDQLTAFAVLVTRRQQTREQGSDTAKWIRKSRNELRAKFPRLSADQMLAALTYINADVYSPEAAQNERATCKELAHRASKN